MTTGVVIGAAIVRAGRLLAQCRAAPAALAGRWELPGGRVEPGESEQEALRREVRRGTRRTDRGGRTDRAGCGALLVVGAGIYAARREHRARRGASGRHAELRWVGVAELSALDWLDADRALLGGLRRSC